MRNIIFSYQSGIQFTALIFTVLGILSGDSATAQEIKQISEFSQYQGVEVLPSMAPMRLEGQSISLLVVPQKILLPPLN
ncbi:hypothetical protein [Rivularia sp. PCC 7116]|uniref:hypothetical protein n=1 Tax=Rivularia sp. PCC 7116 TaxID=373994 RepID=UPI000306C0E0|nr:hypothetical protein [Rivularia sp. PCC 7116]